jgi:hypothetical protein
MSNRINSTLITRLPSSSCPLNQSYSLYLISTALRHNVSQSGEVNAGAHTSIVDALKVALKVSEKVKPIGLAMSLVGALKMEILVVEFGEYWA